MNILFGFVEKKFLPGILMTVITVLTVGTSVMGVGKMAGGFVSNKTQGSEKSASVKKAEANNTSTKTEKAQVAGAAIKNVPAKTGLTATNTGQGNSALTGQTGSTSSNKCIITLFGKQYDVTTLRSTHSGGDVFACNTDMTAQYQARHGTGMSRMQQYLVTVSSGTVASGTTGANGANSTPSQIKPREEDRDKEREDDDD